MNLKKSACIESMYTELPFIKRFEAAKNDGFDAIEFWNWLDKDINQIEKESKRVGIKIQGFNGDVDYSLIDPKQKDDYMEYLKKSINVAKKIGSSSLTIHSNALGDGGLVVDSYDNLSSTTKLCSMFSGLKECATIAEENNILLNLEPLNIYEDHVGNYLETTQMAAEMIELIDSSNLKVLYDVYHMQINEGYLTQTMKKYWDQIGHIHVADTPGRHEPGTGEINYKYIFNVLEELGYKGYVGYELFPQTTTENAVRKIMSY